ncbi:MAG: hypothetical protein SFV15_11905 [Polyangiaceae bacterium]|nr:hypothetical protein [Polyangiaceae bacterium]
MPQHHRATLVVIEYGGSWPRWLHPSQSGDVAVVAQHYPGAPSSLVAQVANRVTRVENMGWQLGHMIFVSNGKTDRDHQAARSILIRGLVARLREVPGGELMLTCSEPAGSRAQRELAATVMALESGSSSKGVSLSLLAWDGSVLYATSPEAKSTPGLARAS